MNPNVKMDISLLEPSASSSIFKAMYTSNNEKNTSLEYCLNSDEYWIRYSDMEKNETAINRLFWSSNFLQIEKNKNIERIADIKGIRRNVSSFSKNTTVKNLVDNTNPTGANWGGFINGPRRSKKDEFTMLSASLASSTHSDEFDKYLYNLKKMPKTIKK